MSYPLGIPIHVSTTVNRRTMIGSMIALSLFAPSITAMAQSAISTPSVTGDDDALDLLRTTSTNLADLETFTFSLETIQGSSTILPGVELIRVQGAVRRPLDLTAKLSVRLVVQEMDIEATILDGTVFIQNPLTSGWQELGQAPEIISMINPDWILQAAIGFIQDAHISNRKQDMVLIEGYVDIADQLGTLMGEEGNSMMSSLLVQTPIDVAFWIDGDGYLTRAELYGPIFTAESPDVERRIDLSDFNQPVEIVAPDI